jgi:nitric-oxide synthase
VKVVDATDFHGCFLNKVRDVVGSNPILLVLTKVDLLPPDTDLTKLQDWVVHEVTHKRRLTLAGVVCVSSRKNTNMKQAVQTMFAERKGRDVYVLGSANVGKSTFIRAALKAMREEGNYGVPGKRLPTASAMPGTTLGVIPLRAFEGKGTMFDTPGVFLHHRLNSILTGNDLKRFGLGSSLKRFQARPRVGDETEDRKDGFKVRISQSPHSTSLIAHTRPAKGLFPLP